MATSGNRDWAYIEAKRRSVTMAKPYAIYQHKRNTGDHIIRPVEYEAPPPASWRLVATIQDGR